jgi:hypothetical protein
VIEVLFACPKCGLGMPPMGNGYQPSLMIPIQVRGRLPNESLPRWIDKAVAPVAARQHLIRSLLCDSDRLSYAFSVADGQAYVGHDLSDIKVEKCTICQASLVSCSTCGSQWCLDHTPNPLVCPGCGARS